METIHSPALRKIVNRQIDMIADSIYGVFFSADDPNKVTFYDVLNRIMLLLQAPVSFVLGEIDPITGKVKRESCVSFNKDFFHTTKINDAIDKAIENNNFYTVFDTEYRLLALIASKNNNTNSRDPSYRFDPIWTSDTHNYEIMYLKLTYVLKKELYIERFGEKFFNLLIGIFDNFREAELSVDIIPLNEEDKKDYDRWYQGFLTSLKIDQSGYKLKYDGVIDKAYRKSKHILSFNTNDNFSGGKKLPNFLFFIRDYSDNKLRCRKEKDGEIFGYNYGLRILICSEQERDIRDFLTRIKDSKDAKKWYLKSFIKNHKEITKSVHKEFWNYLEKDNIDYLIEVLSDRLSETSYSMSDAVFCSGITQFRNPSVNGGIHRALPRDKQGKDTKYQDLDETTKRDLLRIVIIHHIFLGMTDATNLKEVGNFMVMLFQIEVGGRIIGVSGYITVQSHLIGGISNPYSDSPPKQVLENYSQNWSQNYHVYMDSYTRFKKGVRAYFLQLYTKTIAEIFLDSLIEFFKNGETAEDLQNLLNKRFDFLKRFFSYSPICGVICKLEQGDYPNYPNATFENTVKISEKYGLELEFSESHSYFPIALGRDNDVNRFVNLREIAVHMAKAYIIYRHAQTIRTTDLLNKDGILKYIW